MTYKIIEVQMPDPNNMGITYDVTVNFEILVCNTYTRHIALAKVAGFDAATIAWGGILSPTGEWVRQSLDFGEADTEVERDEVVNLICEHFNL
jgi:hypothetical protein